MGMPNRIISKKNPTDFSRCLKSSSERSLLLTRRQKNPPREPQKKSEALTSSSWKEFPSAPPLELVQREDPQHGGGKIASSCRASPRNQHRCRPRDAEMPRGHIAFAWDEAGGNLNVAPAGSDVLCHPKPGDNRTGGEGERKKSQRAVILVELRCYFGDGASIQRRLRASDRTLFDGKKPAASRGGA